MFFILSDFISAASIEDVSLQDRKDIFVMSFAKNNEKKTRFWMKGIEEFDYYYEGAYAVSTPEVGAAARGYTEMLVEIRQKSRRHNLPVTEFNARTPYLNGKLGKRDLYYLCEANLLPIHFAAAHDHADTVKWLAAQGDDLNARSSSYGPAEWRECHIPPKNLSSNGTVPLEDSLPHPDMIKLLLTLGADAKIINPVTGDTPLHYAFLFHRNEGFPPESAKLLVDAGVDLKHKNALGMTVFDTAAMFPDSAAARWVLGLQK